jgi:hypothetical protein
LSSKSFRILKKGQNSGQVRVSGHMNVPDLITVNIESMLKPLLAEDFIQWRQNPCGYRVLKECTVFF